MELLANTGVSRNTAKALVFLAKRTEATSIEIERGTGLRQPEVSITMSGLRKNKWVEKRDIKKEGKGRPVSCYKLIKPMGEILKVIEGDTAKKIKEIKRNLLELKRGLKSL